MVSYGFNSSLEFKGYLADQIAFERDGYEFLFHIKEYERDSSHKFKIIRPEDLTEIPENEQLGRFVYLTIKLKT